MTILFWVVFISGLLAAISGGLWYVNEKTRKAILIVVFIINILIFPFGFLWYIVGTSKCSDRALDDINRIALEKPELQDDINYYKEDGCLNFYEYNRIKSLAGESNVFVEMSY